LLRHAISSSPSLSTRSRILLGLATALVFALIALGPGSRSSTPAHASTPRIYNGKIAFNSRRTHPDWGGFNSEIFVMNSDGNGVVQLTDNDKDDFRPDWSPDGTRLAFDEQSNSGGNIDVYP